MEPVDFGPFLKEARARRGLTQGQLAEQLHVTTAAVSKWERGKCLPDISKIEGLADALGLSVLEVMQCQVRETAQAREEQTEVYTETLRLATVQHRRRSWKVVAAAVIVAAALVCAHLFPLWRVAYMWKTQGNYFHADEVAMLAYIGSPRERAIARQVMGQAEAAFSDLRFTDGRYGALPEYGELSRYVCRVPAVTAEEHSLQLWSARFGQWEGWMWVCYSREGKDAGGEVVTGAWNVPSLWRVEKDERGMWRVTNIIEVP